MSNLFLVIDASSQLNFNTLTKHRVPGAIPVFSKYRFIDIPLSYAKSASISNVGVFTDKNYRSLQDHIGSGARYDLNRRKDGIFLLPPKNQYAVLENYISFQRMFEQFEYFKRSDEDYCLIVPSTLIWFPNLNELLDKHIESGMDISEFRSANNERLYAFMLRKDKLMDYIQSYDLISYHNVNEVFDYSNSETKNIIYYNGNARYITSIESYYKLHMDVINHYSESELVKNLNNVKTKEQLDSPTIFTGTALVSDSVIASGCLIKGAIYKSYISRRTIIEKGAVIKNSIIMNNSIIEEGAVIENAILDKETIVKKDSIIKGNINQPFLSEKKQSVSSSYLPKIAILSVECSPYIKRGGLADMVGSLSKELSIEGTDIKVFIPLYKEIKKRVLSEYINKYEVEMTIVDEKHRVGIYSIEKEKLTYYFIDLYQFFDRDEVYGYRDDPYRFAYYTKCVLEFLDKYNIDIDVFHIHDWHTCLLPLFKKQYKKYVDSISILTIHNMNYVGESDKRLLEYFNLDYYVNGWTFNFLEVGINSVDEITTVSKTYAEELKYSYYSGDLRDAIVRRSNNMYGILNGLSSKINPSQDLGIKAQYNIDDVFTKKPINKKFLCDICDFEYHDNMFIIGMVSRIDEIKGFYYLIDALSWVLENPNIYFVLLGVGDQEIISRLKRLEERFKGRVKLFLEFHATNPNYIYSGADCFMMPSRIEPCGTSQMIALKYGTVPIVRQTGGLNDTINSFDRTTKKGNGFKFYNMDSRDLGYMVNIAYDIYTNDKESWNKLILNGMECDYSFSRCAKEYLNLYNLKRKKD